MTQRPRVCVIWARLGPYHIARLRAAHALLLQHDHDLVALEVASQDTTYDWDTEARTVPFQWEIALPGSVYDHVASTEMTGAVEAALGRIAPEAVAFPSYSTPEAWAALRWCRSHRKTAIMMNVSSATDAPRSSWRESLKQILVRQTDSALVGGKAHADYLADFGLPRDHIARGYSAVDNAFFQDGARREAPPELPGLDDPAPYVIASNRMIARKGLPSLLTAYAAYRERVAFPWRLLLLGDGPLRAELEDMAGGGVVFCGFQQRDTLPLYYGRAEAFVHAAQMDQWALVVNEAMAAGLPVLVSTGAGCAPHLVERGRNGWTFEPGDTEALTDLLVRLHEMPEADRQAMGTASQEIIAEYGPDAFARGLWKAFQDGRARSKRGLGLSARLALTALVHLSRRANSLHAITE
ncbi:MAG: glycosyltransferase family 4 protein [Bacteroidota bacterium]